MAAVGFVGLGRMGGPMAANLARAGHTLVVANRGTAKRDRWVAEQRAAGRAARGAGAPAEVAAQARVVFICVPDGPDVEQVVMGPAGLLEGFARGGAGAGAGDGTRAAGHRPLVIDCSTISPAVARRVAAAAEAAGVDFLDAPVTGGVKGAAEGALTIMAGGSPEAFRRALPYLQAVGRRVVHVGPSGRGQHLKLVNNQIGAVNMIAACEGLLLAAKGGIDPAVALDVLTNGSADSQSLRLLAARALARDFAPGFAVAHRHKDLRLALEAARAAGVPVPVTAMVAELFGVLLARGEGGADQARIIRVFEEWAGIELAQAAGTASGAAAGAAAPPSRRPGA